MGKKGWIALHRSIQDNALWNEKPFSKGQAWVDMILMANHAPNDILLGNEIITLKRGQFHTSELKLAERWGWSRNKVRSYLTLLESQKMSTAKGTTKGTTITIENYTLYQDEPTTQGTAVGTLKKHRKNIEKTSKGTLTTMKNNVNNENNVIGPDKKQRKFTPPTPDEVDEYCKEKNYPLIGNDFCNFYESKGWMVGKNKMVSWRSAVGGWVSRTEKDQPPQKNKTREVEIPEGWIL